MKTIMHYGSRNIQNYSSDSNNFSDFVIVSVMIKLMMKKTMITAILVISFDQKMMMTTTMVVGGECGT